MVGWLFCFGAVQLFGALAQFSPQIPGENVLGNYGTCEDPDGDFFSLNGDQMCTRGVKSWKLNDINPCINCNVTLESQESVQILRLYRDCRCLNLISEQIEKVFDERANERKLDNMCFNDTVQPRIKSWQQCNMRREAVPPGRPQFWACSNCMRCDRTLIYTNDDGRTGLRYQDCMVPTNYYPTIFADFNGQQLFIDENWYIEETFSQQRCERPLWFRQSSPGDVYCRPQITAYRICDPQGNCGPCIDCDVNLHFLALFDDCNCQQESTRHISTRFSIIANLNNALDLCFLRPFSGRMCHFTDSNDADIGWCTSCMQCKVDSLNNGIFTPLCPNYLRTKIFTPYNYTVENPGVQTGDWIIQESNSMCTDADATWTTYELSDKAVCQNPNVKSFRTCESKDVRCSDCFDCKTEHFYLVFYEDCNCGVKRERDQPFFIGSEQ